MTGTPLPSPPPARLHLSAHGHTLPLHDIAATRGVEQHHMALLPAHALMQRAGLAVARVALAVAPHAQTIWIACGPGNNGGDGLQAGAWLQAQGKRVLVTLLQQPEALPADARTAHADAMAAGVGFVDSAPPLAAHDLCIDALLGIGASRAPSAAMQACITAMQQVPCQTLAVDIPTGLHAETGHWLEGASAAQCVHAHHTVTLLTLKPGLFTAHGRDASGQVWFDGLGTTASPAPDAASATAWLQGADFKAVPRLPESPPAYASHKGSFGDVCIVGGAPGMTGAAWLAGSAALHVGAGRVYVGHLAADAGNAWAELMPRALPDVAALEHLPLTSATTACGCGGGTVIADFLPALLDQCPRLVIDADGLNAVAADAGLQALLRKRASRQQWTTLTPHPLEAARLLGLGAQEVQTDRMTAAAALATQFQCMVVLKGSGSVCAAPALHTEPAPASSGCFMALAEQYEPEPVAPLPTVHYSGNARLATAGTGDVLAGCMAACWAQAHQANPGASGMETALHAANAAVQLHGHTANIWNYGTTLTASVLAALLPRYSG